MNAGISVIHIRPSFLIFKDVWSILQRRNRVFVYAALSQCQSVAVLDAVNVTLLTDTDS